jgi:hypothetical protein
VAANWPTVEIEQLSDGVAVPPPDRITPNDAVIRLAGGAWTELDRAAAQVRLHAPEDSRKTELLHPMLATVAVVFSWWYGRNAFHGGAFRDSVGGAWAILGDRGGGKSSTLAALAANGFDVVTDDLLAVSDGSVFAGPRVLDLRLDAVSELGLERIATEVRSGTRRRVALGAVPGESELVGWLFLEWGPSVSLSRLRPGEWLQRATAQLNTITPGTQSLVALADTEAWLLTRPQSFDSLEPTVDEVRALVER